MEKLDLKLLPKDTMKAFKNALKFVPKDKDLYSQVAGVYFACTKDEKKKFIVASNRKVAITYLVDFPDDFINKVVNKNGEVISDTYPTLQIPSDISAYKELNIDELKSLYEQATEEVKELNITQKKLKKDGDRIGVPIADEFEVDYFIFKDFIKLIESVGETTLYCNDKKQVGVFYKADKSVSGFVANEYIGSPNNNIKKYFS